MDSKNFFDIADHIPQQEGYQFVGWCLKPDDLDGSLVKHTENYDWVPKYRDDIQVYAKWKEKPKETETKTEEETENKEQIPDVNSKDGQKLSGISIKKLTAGKDSCQF